VYRRNDNNISILAVVLTWTPSSLTCSLRLYAMNGSGNWQGLDGDGDGLITTRLSLRYSAAAVVG